MRTPCRPLVPLVPLLLVVALFSGCGGASTPAPTPPPAYSWPYDVVLARPEWLAARLDQVRVVDVSERGPYLRAHIPGAAHAFWQDTVERDALTYGKLAGGQSRARLFGALGIADAGTTVIVYDRSDGRAAARFAWSLWYAGHPNVRVLDGGLAAWTAEGRPLARGETAVMPATYRDLPDESVLISRCDLARAASERRGVIVDVRTDAERAETWSGTLITGEIPGSVRFPWPEWTQAQIPAFRSPDELRARLAALGVTPDTTVYLYGLTSADAAPPFFALKALAYVNVRLYDGGWAEWGANPAITQLPSCG